MDSPRRTDLDAAGAFAAYGVELLARMPLAAAVVRLDDPDDDESMRLVAANAAASKTLGFDLSALRGRPLREIFPNAGGLSALAEIARGGDAARTREVAYADERVREGIYAFRAVPLPDRCVGLLFEDLTDRRRAEAEVRESEARCRALADATMESVAIHEAGRIVEVNRASERLYGYTRAELVGMMVWDLVVPATREAARADVEALKDQPREYLAMRKDGTTIPIQVTSRSCLYQGRDARVVVTRDLSEQRMREAAVRISEERFRVVARATNDAIWELDMATQEFARGESFAALFGYRPEEVGRTSAWWHERVHPDDRARIDAGLDAWRASGVDTYADEYRFRRADGTWAHVFDRAVMMRDASGAPVRVIGAMMDISERKQMEAKLLLADRLASLGTLAAGVAHEINNPLSYVIANVRLVEDRLRALANEAPEAHDAPALRDALDGAAAALDEAREGAARVHRIVADLKTFACAEDERRRPTDVRRVLEAALQLAEHDVRRRARLVRAIEAVPPVLANEARLGQVFLTLVVNAAESIAPGAADANEVRVVVRRDEARVLVEVCDTGPGLPAEARGRMFDPFFSVRASGERKGIGLSICHAIVTALGGEIEVESELSRGTCFRVFLPIAPNAEEPARPSTAPPPRSAPPSPRSGRVLVVDDEPMVGRMVERALGQVHKVTSVTAAKDALDRIAAGDRFDVILCDLMMPAMSGMDLYERVEAVAPDQAARMVFLSGGAFTRRAREFLERRPSLEKPFDLRALEAAIQARLS